MDDPDPPDASMEDDEDAGVAVTWPDAGPQCPAGRYTGVLECTFAVTMIRLSGPIAFEIAPQAGAAGLFEVTGDITLMTEAPELPVEVAEDFGGSFDCERGHLEVMSPPLGGQVDGFLSATREVTLRADYDAASDSFRGDVSLPGTNVPCNGTLSTE